MKRSERDALKKMTGPPKEPHTNPDQAERCKYPGNIAGAMHVRGEITIDPGIREAHSRAASEKKEDTRQSRKWVLDVVTLIVIAIYAFLTACQAHIASKNLKDFESVE